MGLHKLLLGLLFIENRKIVTELVHRFGDMNRRLTIENYADKTYTLPKFIKQILLFKVYTKKLQALSSTITIHSRTL